MRPSTLQHVLAKHLVAVKIIDKTKLDEVEKQHLIHEIRLMKLIQHPHIVRLYQVQKKNKKKSFEEEA